MIYSISYDKLTDSQKALALSLQGIVNRREKTIFLDVDNYKNYLPINAEVQSTDLEFLLKKYASYLDGFVCYNLSSSDVAINMATTISAAFDVLGVPSDLCGFVEQFGLKKLYDLSDVVGNASERQKKVFDYCLDKLNKDGLVHQVVRQDNFHLRLRDLAISQRFACIYTDESDNDRAFRRYVLSKLHSNIPIYGWTTDEIMFVRDISEFGNYVLPSDWSCNHSFFSHNGETLLKQSRWQAPIRPNKHYVALVVSDGDNIQWLERNFSAPDGSFGRRMAYCGKYKMTWTISPSLVKLCPNIAKYIYQNAKYDYFIAAVSGIGYANLLEYPSEHLQQFTQKTQVAMEKSNLNIVCMLDNINNTKNKKKCDEVLQSYSKFDTIQGGVWELDPDRYSSGDGKIFWSQGKPFVSVRFSLWHPSCQMEQVTHSWLDEMAAQVNAMPVSPNTEEGYSIVNVHPWTMTQQSVDYFVSQLDSDKVELVYADELIDMIKNHLSEK